MTTLGKCNLSADCKTAEFHIDSEYSLTIHLTEDLGTTGKVTKLDEKTLVAEFKDYGTKLEIEKSSQNGIDFYQFSWYTPSTTKYLKDTVYLDVEKVQWFGGPQLLQQAWPILNSASGNKGYDFVPYVVMDTFLNQASGHERYYLCSKKAGLYIPSNICLFSKLSPNGYLSLQSQADEFPYSSFPRSSEDEAFLSYTFSFPSTNDMSLVDFHLSLSKLYLGHPKACIDDLLIEKPIWTTWCRYGKGVTQEQVLKFKEEIIAHKFPISQLELDDKYTTQYGDFEIDKTKFPDFKAMISQLQASGIRLTSWIHPFVNLESETGKDVKFHQYFVKGLNDRPVTIKWWDGEGYAVDFTNPKSCGWFKECLQKLQKEGIYSFKFDAGEVAYLPKNFKLTEGKEPNDYSRAYSKFAAEFGTAVENRVGSGTQNLAIMTRTIDRLSKWIDIGLQTVIPSCLLFSLQGYYWNLPDIIGGNGFELTDTGNQSNLRTDSELFIRWVEVNAFLMVLQFSFCPWDYTESEKVVEICHKVLNQRTPYITYIKSEAKKSINNGIPLIRPLWWHLETKDAFLCDDQFFVGDRLLVAPVVREDTYKRTVILPEGHWKDEQGNEYHGPQNIVIDVPLERIPHFWKLNSTEESGYCTLF